MIMLNNNQSLFMDRLRLWNHLSAFNMSIYIIFQGDATCMGL
jgi:hypothetical protein